MTSALARLFSDPPAEFSPAPFWWWSGERLEAGRLRWQLERLVEGGVRNVVLINLAPSGPMYGADADDPLLFSDEWWELFLGVCQDARELGVRLWFYDQIGFSGANFQGRLAREHPELAGRHLGRVVAAGEGPLEVACPQGAEPLLASVVALDDEGRARGPSRQVEMEAGRASHEAKGPHSLDLVYASTRGFDYLSPTACARLIDTIHGAIESRAGEYLGNVIVGSFQDEMPALPTWGPHFAEEFARRAGYDLVPLLGALWEGEDSGSARVRADYQRVRAELAEEAFFIPLWEWHEARGLLCGFDNMARGGELGRGVAYYGDYQRTHRWFAAPGSDNYGEPKLNTSLAHLYGRRRSWIEAFHSTGWGGTLEETYDWLLPWLRAGATVYNPHAVYYSTRGGWWEWAPPSTCWRQPYWRHYHLFARAVSRLCAVLSQGSHVCEVGVLYPATTAQGYLSVDGRLLAAGKVAQDTYAALVGRLHWGDPVAGALDRDGRDFDVLDEASVQGGVIADGALAVAGERFAAIVLPGCRLIEEATAAALARFAEAGGRLVAVGAVPDELEELFASGRAIRVGSVEEVAPALADLPRSVRAPVPTLRRRTEDAEVVFVPAAYPRATLGGAVSSEDEPWSVNYTFDPRRCNGSLTVAVAGVAGHPELWDPVGGDRRVLAGRPSGDGVEVDVPFDHGPGALLVWPRGPEPSTAALAPVVAPGPAGPLGEVVVATLSGPWEAAVEGTLDNHFGDLDRPSHDGSPAVQTWSFSHRVEAAGEDGLAEGWHLGAEGRDTEEARTAGWQEVHATYGPFGWWTGPRPVEELPDSEAGDGPWGRRGGGAGPGPEWRPAVYSLSRGIRRDPAVSYSLGPKGHVLEEFLHFGAVAPGEGVQLATTVWAEEPASLHLAIGAPAAKRAWLNGTSLGHGGSGYLWMVPVELAAGRNTIEIRLVAEGDLSLRTLIPVPVIDATIRAYWALVKDPGAFSRPEWLTSVGHMAKGERARFRKDLDLAFPVRGATVLLGTSGSGRLVVNGAEVGRQEDQYEGWLQLYALEGLRRGANTIEVEVEDVGKPVAVLVDAVVEGDDGITASLTTGPGWTVEGPDGASAEAELRRDQWLEPAWNHLWRRPHPLPASAWLEDEPADGTVVAVVPDALNGERRVEWLSWPLPPGATALHLELCGPARIWVRGHELPLREDTVELAGPTVAGVRATARVEVEGGPSAGALLVGPVTYTMGPGPIDLGAWAGQGLGSWSGGVRYRTTFVLAGRPAGRLLIDLGRVRGTAEVWVNGQSAGARIWSPYRFDVTVAASEGENRIEILVLNTLAPYLGAVSPTHYVFPGQTDSGLFGPVRLLAL